MTAFFCVDDRMGMLFNHRRQSRDRTVCADILAQTGDAGLCVTPYTAKLFEPFPEAQVAACEDPAAAAAPDGFCFLEDPAAIPDHSLDRIVLYRWNRHYPSDARFPIDLSEPAWQLTETSEFPGSSHEKITKEVYLHHE